MRGKADERRHRGSNDQHTLTLLLEHGHKVLGEVEVPLHVDAHYQVPVSLIEVGDLPLAPDARVRVRAIYAPVKLQRLLDQRPDALLVAHVRVHEGHLVTGVAELLLQRLALFVLN